MKRYLWNALPSIGFCFLVCHDGLLPAARAQNVPLRISIVVVAGEGVTSPVRQRVSQDPVVRVEDDDHRPVPGVPVVFALPVSGTSGEFANGAKTMTLLTNNAGEATAHGLKTNDIPGKLQIYVTASFHGLRARTLINQIVEGGPGAKTQPPTMRSKSSGKWKWVVLGVAAAGGAGAGFYFGNRSSGNSPISIGTGTVVFGSPR